MTISQQKVLIGHDKILKWHNSLMANVPDPRNPVLLGRVWLARLHQSVPVVAGQLLTHICTFYIVCPLFWPMLLHLSVGMLLAQDSWVNFAIWDSGNYLITRTICNHRQFQDPNSTTDQPITYTCAISIACYM
jgi:hypothetical protein